MKTSKRISRKHTVNASGKDRNKRRKGSRKSLQLIPALVVAGGVCGLATLPANALELGEVNVDSSLGQPLRASIAYALNANEQLHGYCISLRSGPQGSDAPAVNDARISVSGNRIQFSGITAIRKPLLNIQVVVDCAYTPHLVRDYVLLVDPVASNTAAQSMLAGTADFLPGKQANAPVETASRRNASADAGKPFTTSPIATNAVYRVQNDDTVSTIVSRIDNRSMGLWPSVKLIFTENPDAFVEQDVNRLIAGSELVIPDLSGVSSAAIDNSTVLPISDVTEPQPVAALVVESPATTETLPTAENSLNVIGAEEVALIEEIPVVNDTVIVSEEITVDDQTAVLQPGDVVMPAAGTLQTEFAAPAASADDQAVAVPVVTSAASANAGTSGAWGWLIWLAGTGVALVLGFFLFGRKIRDRFGAARVPTPAAPAKRPKIVADVDFEFEDTISAEAISLDADLDAGTGLESGAQVDVAEDFGFSASGQVEHDLDLELTESAAAEPEASPTDIIPPNHREEDPSILDAEDPPVDDDEYDMSMIVDATKQPLDQFDATARDLQAVQIDQDDPSSDSGDDTMIDAVDIQALEQDYQEEFTATLAANTEIERVAMELASGMDKDESIDVTNEMPVADSATVESSDKDLTAVMPAMDATNEMPEIDLPAVSNSEFTAELTANLPTSIDAENDSDIDSDGSETAMEMSAGSDITVDIDIQSGKVDTKKK
jgi:hypothetical protein